MEENKEIRNWSDMIKSQQTKIKEREIIEKKKSFRKIISFFELFSFLTGLGILWYNLGFWVMFGVWLLILFSNLASFREVGRGSKIIDLWSNKTL